MRRTGPVALLVVLGCSTPPVVDLPAVPATVAAAAESPRLVLGYPWAGMEGLRCSWSPADGEVADPGPSRPVPTDGRIPLEHGEGLRVLELRDADGLHPFWRVDIHADRREVSWTGNATGVGTTDVFVEFEEHGDASTPVEGEIPALDGGPRLVPCSPESTLTPISRRTMDWTTDASLRLRNLGPGDWMLMLDGYGGCDAVDFRTLAGFPRRTVRVRPDVRGTVRFEGFPPGIELFLTRTSPDLLPPGERNRLAHRTLQREVRTDPVDGSATVRVEPGLHRIDDSSSLLRPDDRTPWIRVEEDGEVVVTPWESPSAWLRVDPSRRSGPWRFYVREFARERGESVGHWRLLAWGDGVDGHLEGRVAAGPVEWCLLDEHRVVGRGMLDLAANGGRRIPL